MFLSIWCERVAIWFLVGIVFFAFPVSSATVSPPPVVHQAVTKPATSPHPIETKVEQVAKKPVNTPKTETLADNQPLEEVYSKQESLLDMGDLIKMYTVFGILLLVLISVLVWLKKSGWAERMNRQSQIGMNPYGIKPAVPSSKPQGKPQLPNPNMTPSQLSQFELEKDLYKPAIAHREQLGHGRELVTVFLAEKWYFLGVTGNQIHLLANLSEEQNVSTTQVEAGLKATVAEDPSFSKVYEKYVQQTAKPDSANIPVSTDLKNPETHMVNYQVDDLEEFEIPDFEDVFEQA